jgi:hypothetical protein
MFDADCAISFFLVRVCNQEQVTPVSPRTSAAQIRGLLAGRLAEATGNFPKRGKTHWFSGNE